MSTAVRPALGSPRPARRAEVAEVIVYEHSALCYWWPLWAAGYVMALLTWFRHDEAVIDGRAEWFHPSQSVGMIYTLLLLLLIVITSTKIKGMKAAVILAALSFLALLFVHFDWWGAVLGWFGQRSVSLSLGYYLFSSSLLVSAWVASVFGVDHLSFWRFRHGQVTHEYLGGIVNNSYDTANMTILLDRQDDFFRHWVVGLGSGDLHLETMGGRGVDMRVANVLFVGSKMFKIQRLIAQTAETPPPA